MPRRLRRVTLLPPPTARTQFAEIAIDSTVVVSMATTPICWCVVVSHNETEGYAEAAMNVPSLDRAMYLGSIWVLWMDH